MAFYQATVYKQSLVVPMPSASLLTVFEMGQYTMHFQWLCYQYKLASSLLCSTFLANKATGLACKRANTWAAC
jgi:hypothetical protein